MPYATIDKGSKYFNTVLYTGNGVGGTNITGVGFQPDLVWIKRRSAVEYHVWNDAVRGLPKNLYSNVTSAEDTGSIISAIISDGFTVQTDASVNSSGSTYVAWNWKANGTGSSNTSGTITSTVSANTTSGFSVVSYTGNGTGGATFGHGLGVNPKMFIIKQRTDANAWVIYHASVDVTGDYTLRFTSGAKTNGNDTNNDTAPTSSLITLGASSLTNQNTSTYIAYCFAEVKGYSKFGSYTGNGSADGTFIYTGFKPAFFMVKRTDTTGSWIIVDNKRNTTNPETLLLLAHSSNAEENTTSFSAFFGDFLSNGVKLRDGTVYTGGTNFNISGGTYIYMAFAENPFVSSKGIPTTAR
jgi:hypothetical protein